MSLGPTNFKIVRGMLKEDLLDFLGYYAYDRANSPDSKPDGQVPNTPALYDDPAMRTLLHYFLYDMILKFCIIKLIINRCRTCIKTT